jgi:hypothetical protein
MTGAMMRGKGRLPLGDAGGTGPQDDSNAMWPVTLAHRIDLGRDLPQRQQHQAVVARPVLVEAIGQFRQWRRDDACWNLAVRQHHGLQREARPRTGEELARILQLAGTQGRHQAHRRNTQAHAGHGTTSTDCTSIS